MAKKRKPPNPQQQPTFKADPFSALKGVVLDTPPAPQPEPPAPVKPKVVKEHLDVNLFLQAMEGVKRLDGDKHKAQLVTLPDKPVRKALVKVGKTEASPEDQEVFVQAIGQLRLDVTFAEGVPDEDVLKPLGTNRLRQLKKGIIPLDRQLDLHGLTRDEAIAALHLFLRNACSQKEKAVLVITGKGLNSTGEPVLLQAVAAWLRDAGKEFVLEFAPAPREMGGSGAFVIFLRA